jgi:hypothetical protein
MNSLPRIHGTCKEYDFNALKTVVKEGENYGGIRRYADCQFKGKTVECNSKGCKHWKEATQ